MRSTHRTVVPFILSALVTFAASSTNAKMPDNLHKFLRDIVKLGEADIGAIDNGQIITRLLPATDKGEVAVFGIVRVSATPDQFEALARDPKRFHAMEGIDQMGVFSDPPVIADVKPLVVPKEDIESLRECKPGSCDVKLTDDALEKVAAADWSAPDAEARATAAFKEMIVSLADAYDRGGVEALGTIVDKKQPKSRAAEFHRLLENSPYLYKYVPDFHKYIEHYPSGEYKDAVNSLYWTKDSFSPKPVISVCANTVARDEDHVIVGCRLLAATHFFNAALDICMAVPGEHDSGLYLVDVYRVRIDPPTGMLAGAAMNRVKSGITQGVEKTLDGIRMKLAKK